MRLLRNPIILVFFLISISAGAYFYIKNKKSNAFVNPIRTELAVKRNLSQFVNASGKLKAVVQITVGSLVAGRVVKVFAADNDFVKKNQILAVLDDGVGDSEVKRTTADLTEARANLKFQEKFYHRQKALYDAGQLAQNSFDSVIDGYEIAKARVQKLEATLELNKKQYENLFVRAPEDSIVISKMIDLGQMVTAQLQATALYTLAADLRAMEAHIDVDEADIGLVKQGQDVICSVDAFPKMKFTAQVKYIKYLANIVDSVVTYDVVLNVANPTLKLRPGMTVNVDINVAGSKDAITVPNKAFRIDEMLIENAAQVAGLTVVKASATNEESCGSEDYLWVMKDEKTIAQVEVKLGAMDDKYTEVISGITFSDKIVSEVDDVKRENLLLKGIFGKPAGGLGK